MNVLITGGRGYVGENLIPFLAGQGLNCVTYDKKDNEDIFDTDTLLRKLKGKDGIIHLAGLRGPECEYEGFKEKDFIHLNLEGSKAVLDATYKAGLKRFVFASSLEVYGFPSQWAPNVKMVILPITDKTPYAENNHIYAKCKLDFEEYMKNSNYDMTCIALRFGGMGSRSLWGISWINLAKRFACAIKNNLPNFDWFNLGENGGVDQSKADKYLI